MGETTPEAKTHRGLLGRIGVDEVRHHALELFGSSRA
jgi:hypothetical protein